MSEAVKRRFLCLLLFVAPLAHADFIDKSEAAFFPKSFAGELSLYKSFKTTWWNFLVMDTQTDVPLSGISELCETLRTSGAIERMACGDELAELLPLAESWAKDVSIREPAPTPSDLQRSFSAALVQASLPIPPALLRLLRVDPLESYRVLQKHGMDRQPLQLSRKAGLFFDPANKRWVIPFRPSFAPGISDKYEALLGTISKRLPADSWWVIGSHASAWENRRQVQRDLGMVSKIGTLLLALFAFSAWKLRRTRLFWGIPLTFFGSGLGAITSCRPKLDVVC